MSPEPIDVERLAFALMRHCSKRVHKVEEGRRRVCNAAFHLAEAEAIAAQYAAAPPSRESSGGGVMKHGSAR